MNLTHNGVAIPTFARSGNFRVFATSHQVLGYYHPPPRHRTKMRRFDQTCFVSKEVVVGHRARLAILINYDCMLVHA